MRKLTAREAGRYTARLDNIANTLEHKWQELGISQKQALDWAFEVDKISKAIETESQRQYEASAKQAQVLEGEPDEPYMPEHFNQSGVLDGQGDPDEPYMSLFGDLPGRPNNEGRQTVSERTEAPVEGLNEYSDGFKKQPSQPSVGGSPFPPKRAADLSGKRYIPQTDRTRS